MKRLVPSGFGILFLALSSVASQAEIVFELVRDDINRVLSIQASGSRTLGALVAPSSTGTLVGVDFTGFAFSPTLSVGFDNVLFQATTDSGVLTYDLSGTSPPGMLRLASPLSIASAADGGSTLSLSGSVTFAPFSPGDWALMPAVGSTGGLDFLRPPGPGGDLIEPGPSPSSFWVVVPEPTTGSLMLLGGLTALLSRRR